MHQTTASRLVRGLNAPFSTAWVATTQPLLLLLDEDDDLDGDLDDDLAGAFGMLMVAPALILLASLMFGLAFISAETVVLFFFAIAESVSPLLIFDEDEDDGAGLMAAGGAFGRVGDGAAGFVPE